MMLRRLFPAALVLFAAASPAFAQTDAPEPHAVDVVEVAGPIDRPIENYLLDRIADAQERQIELLVIQIDSLGFLKTSDDETLPPVVRAVRDSTVPIAVQVGPRGARAAGGVSALVEAAHLAAMGPSSRIDFSQPLDLGRPNADRAFELAAVADLGRSRGRPTSIEAQAYSANEALDAGAIDLVSPSVADLLQRVDGTTISLGGVPTTLEVPKDLTTIRFWQPGPLRRTLHAFSNPALAYLMLFAGIMLLVFEMSQPGFGVAGATALGLLASGAYGLSVLPTIWWAVALLLGGSALMWLDVIRDELLVPTWLGIAGFAAGSYFLLPRESEATTLSVWIIIGTTFGAFVFFAPIMTLIKRQRRPITTATKRRIVGEAGEVRSMLNPEGYVMVGGELWRARLEPSGRLRVGEQVTVSGVDGAVLLVSGPETSPN